MEELESLVLDRPQKVGSRTGVPFVVFPYEPDRELAVEDKITGFVEKLDFRGRNVAVIDIRDAVFSILRDKGLLDTVVEVEKEDGSTELEGGLKSTLFESTDNSHGALIDHVLGRVRDADVAVVYRFGVLYPFSSLSVVLSHLENEVGIPLIAFYPAVVEGKSLTFLDETDGSYYRAKVI
jgi:hypothetical protein